MAAPARPGAGFRLVHVLPATREDDGGAFAGREGRGDARPARRLTHSARSVKRHAASSRGGEAAPRAGLPRAGRSTRRCRPQSRRPAWRGRGRPSSGTRGRCSRLSAAHLQVGVVRGEGSDHGSKVACYYHYHLQVGESAPEGCVSRHVGARSDASLTLPAPRLSVCRVTHPAGRPVPRRKRRRSAAA